MKTSLIIRHMILTICFISLRKKNEVTCQVFSTDAQFLRQKIGILNKLLGKILQ